MSARTQTVSNTVQAPSFLRGLTQRIASTFALACSCRYPSPTPACHIEASSTRQTYCQTSLRNRWEAQKLGACRTTSNGGCAHGAGCQSTRPYATPAAQGNAELCCAECQERSSECNVWQWCGLKEKCGDSYNVCQLKRSQQPTQPAVLRSGPGTQTQMHAPPTPLRALLAGGTM